MTRPFPIVTTEEVVAQLSERGRLEWELATSKAALVKALTDEPVAESGHVPTPEPVVPAGNQLTTPE